MTATRASLHRNARTRSSRSWRNSSTSRTWVARCASGRTSAASPEDHGRPRCTGFRRSRSDTGTATRCRISYRDALVEHGMRLSGLSPDGSLVEMIEIPQHPWFIGCQFHPELRSRPTRPHPLFAGFIAAAAKHARSRLTATSESATAAPGTPTPPGSAARTRRGWRLTGGLPIPPAFPADALFLIAGPCVLEDDGLNVARRRVSRAPRASACPAA